MFAQHAADLIDRESFVGELGGLERFAGADRTVAAVLVAIAVEQVLMAEFLVASAVAMKLREQRRIFLCDLIRLARRPEEAGGVERHALARSGCGRWIGRRAHRPRDGAEREARQ